MRYIDYDVLFDILDNINNNNVTTKSLANKYNFSERTIRRYLAILKNNNIIAYHRDGLNKGWKICIK